MKEAMKMYLEGRLAYHKANVSTFLAQPVGVAEHGDFMETFEQQLEKVAYYKELIDALEEV